MGSNPKDLSAWITNKLPFYGDKINKTLVLFKDNIMFEINGIYPSVKSSVADYKTLLNDVLTIREYYAGSLEYFNGCQ